jgi:hypothetical protein
MSSCSDCRQSGRKYKHAHAPLLSQHEVKLQLCQACWKAQDWPLTRSDGRAVRQVRHGTVVPDRACTRLRTDGTHTACSTAYASCGPAFWGPDLTIEAPRRAPICRSTPYRQRGRRVYPAPIAMSWSIHAGGGQAAVCCGSCTPTTPTTLSCGTLSCAIGRLQLHTFARCPSRVVSTQVGDSPPADPLAAGPLSPDHLALHMQASRRDLLSGVAVQLGVMLTAQAAAAAEGSDEIVPAVVRVPAPSAPCQHGSKAPPHSCMHATHILTRLSGTMARCLPDISQCLCLARCCRSGALSTVARRCSAMASRMHAACTQTSPTTPHHITPHHTASSLTSVHPPHPPTPPSPLPLPLAQASATTSLLTEDAAAAAMTPSAKQVGCEPWWGFWPLHTSACCCCSPPQLDVHAGGQGVMCQGRFCTCSACLSEPAMLDAAQQRGCVISAGTACLTTCAPSASHANNLACFCSHLTSHHVQPHLNSPAHPLASSIWQPITTM